MESLTRAQARDGSSWVVAGNGMRSVVRTGARWELNVRQKATRVTRPAGPKEAGMLRIREWQLAALAGIGVVVTMWTYQPVMALGMLTGLACVRILATRER